MPAEDKLDKIASHLDDIHKMCSDNASRMDALDSEHKNDRAEAAAWRAKADEEEAKKREKPDAARRRTDSTSDDKGAFADAQMRCDAAYQAWGKSAPYALAGESLRDFRVRMLSGIKAHSKRYGQSDLSLVGDAAVFDTIEGAIINDAVVASSAPAAAGSPLRKVVKRDEHGRTITTFHGDPLVTWAQFAGGATRFGRIVRPAGH